MTNFKHISASDALALINDQPTTIVDIRDATSFAAGHIENAQLINNENVQDFIREADLDQPLVVCCYHGNSSQGAAQFFTEQGFEEVYSLDGGFEHWRQDQAVSTLKSR